ncbi:hypothetical protein BBD42_27870 [Paenibacillus sp. BIHB 4019]|uniref:Uncharacterized protein n=1 Tax=Paenibacillus sp. BIHB 4019 TaxID=1870819 RepID=A0A1B2DQ92_9BACL|nr:hypothetical protein BBD42_27870 [Paenibacillus sp. BIHB 4019]
MLFYHAFFVFAMQDYDANSIFVFAWEPAEISLAHTKKALIGKRQCLLAFRAFYMAANRALYF